MANYLVTYDLNKTGQNYDGLIGAIKKFTWYGVLKSAWLIKSTSSAAEISKYLLPHIDKNDRLLVCEINSNRDGWLDQAAWDFLKK
ncbi:hypothetical protein A3D88_03770 [Candidatus Peribacteria bacterium RIFCSPHIGHO2_02_FULL_52_16]|nr:MAG: hypothetical protein A2706_04585 [Candidatus Peribacteria bacterium RIFCSPHIGHO2_01_FULL_51_35]OGJ61799.1 MAG: hypothetical protein A3D88_03770 [Candidatus Peribacteria bacterium RIFCSPHIGHO2_02_FULL_52_16]